MPHSPKAVVGEVLAELRQQGDPARARGAARYFKSHERLRFFGVDTARVRRLAARVSREQRGWGVPDAIAFAEQLVARPELEAKTLGMIVLGKHRAAFPQSLFARTERWLARQCSDWASTDALCGEVVAPLLETYPRLIPRLHAWRASRHLYVRRASAVALVRMAHHGRRLEEAYGAALALGGEPHHLLQKAAGWLLREAGTTDMRRLERFLGRQGPHLSRTTVSYAIERFPPRTRAALLAATRGRRRGAVL